MSSTDRIEKKALLKAPRSRFWRALTETGFDGIPASRRAQALQANDGGWSAQMELIRKYLALHAS